MARQMKAWTDEQLSAANIDPDVKREMIIVLVREAGKRGGFVNEETLNAWGVDPDSPEILWVPEHGAPAFQFDDQKVRPIAGQVNELFEAQGDPYGVADFWLLPHSMAGLEVPADLLVAGSELPLSLAQMAIDQD